MSLADASDWWGWIANASAFTEIAENDRHEILDHMLREGILHEDGGRLSLGPRGERLYGFRHFAALYSVFSTPEVLKVLWGTQEIGTVDAVFVEVEDGRPLVFLLGGRAWRATRPDFERGVIHVEPAESGKAPSWIGRPRMLSPRLCHAIRAVLAGADEDPRWSRRSRDKLAAIRGGYEFLAAGQFPLVETGGGYDLWTFAGGLVNHLVAKAIETEIGERVTASNLKIAFREAAGRSSAAISHVVRSFADAERPTDLDAARLAAGIARTRLSKFQPCLPLWIESETLASMVTDPTGARELVAAIVPGIVIV